MLYFGHSGCEIENELNLFGSVTPKDVSRICTSIPISRRQSVSGEVPSFLFRGDKERSDASPYDQEWIGLQASWFHKLIVNLPTDCYGLGNPGWSCWCTFIHPLSTYCVLSTD